MVFITGAVTGQGWAATAVALAEQGADVIAVEICKSIDSVGYALSTSEDLEETARLVRQTGRSNASLFLCSDQTRYITGTTLPIDGGAMLR